MGMDSFSIIRYPVLCIPDIEVSIEPQANVDL